MQKNTKRISSIFLIIAFIGCMLMMGQSSVDTIRWYRPSKVKEFNYRKTSTRVGRVSKENSFGSGVIIHNSKEHGTYILTAAHVVDGDKVSTGLENDKADALFLIATPTSNYYTEKYIVLDTIKINKKLDLSLMKVRYYYYGPDYHVRFPRRARIGQEIYHIGNPLGYDLSLTKGIISYINRWVEFGGIATNMYQTDAAIAGGSSGGAIYTKDSKLLGIVSCTSGAIPSLGIYNGDFSFFVPYDIIINFLKDTPFPQTGGN